MHERRSHLLLVILIGLTAIFLGDRLLSGLAGEDSAPKRAGAAPFRVAPGADPNQIKLSFAGAVGMRVDAASGDWVLKVGGEEVRLHKPAVYQPAVAAVYDRRLQSSTNSSPVAAASGPDARHSSLVTRHCSFVLGRNNEVPFRVAGYDPKPALVIDPVLSYLTYLRRTGGDVSNSIALDASGNAYVAGWTAFSDFSTTPGAFQTLFGGGSSIDAFVVKLNTAGSAHVFSTCLGGTGADVSYGIAVGATGNAYVGGLS